MPLKLPSGKVEQIIGGSATYVAYAASNLLKPIQQISDPAGVRFSTGRTR